MSKCILDLDALDPERETVKLDGKEYEIYSFEDFSLKENARLRKVGATILDGQIAPDSVADEAEYEKQLDSFLSIVVPGVSVETMKAMSYAKKLALLTAFWIAAANRRTRDTAAQETGETQ